MKQIIERISVTALFVLLPYITSGQETTPVPPPGGQTPVRPPGPQPSSQSFQLQNPLNVGSIEELLRLILDIVVIFATPIVVFFVIYSGFLFVTAQGNEERLKKAKTAFLWTIIGGLIVLGASTILTVIIGTIRSIQG